ncbi:DUF3383 family protein [Leptospira noguchii]|uniref:PF11863 family protein n=2 Tax=Leptospira noguchii TaxID=28182 RepID=M6UUE1_9LEPT|nr:DUF3383 family protein [Leptospira noguchii]EMO26369.1 PF11863 family protein [Leptospira interrogans serovar Bataviae str. HAI135]EKR73606.1 PF11863 family protein [Leptospira noguchii str. 2006001870]EMO40893.1 PF11863 family protein [Leptospira noguchii serovar Autumnalis str. ZUN142]TQE81697.1 DUF3383 domain-containing protein [Leptospira noguchii]UOG29670.1 DUF3383 domain-containing protein [Leptospira noguchii]
MSAQTVSKIEPISINLFLRNTPVSQMGFGLPLILGVKEPTYSLQVSGNSSGLIWKSAHTGIVFIQVKYVVSGNNTSLSVVRAGTGTENDPYVISVNVSTDANGAATSTAHQVKLAAESISNIAGANKIVEVTEVANSGSGVVSAFAQTALSYERYMEISSSDDLLELGFTSSDKEYIQAAQMFRQTPRPKRVAVFLLTSWSSALIEISALRNSGKDSWFKTIATTHDKETIHVLGDYLASIEKMFFACTDDLNVLTGRNSIWEYITLHKTPDSFPEAAWVGNSVPRRVGSYNYAYLPLDGVENSGYTNSQVSSVFSENGNLIVDFGGKQVPYPGISTGNVYADVVENRSWLKARLKENISSLFLNSDVVPYTIQGIQMIEAKMREVFVQAGVQGIIAPVETDADKTRSDLGDYQYKINLPDTIDEIPTNDRNNRVLPNVTFSCRLRGAINEVDIDGELT